MGVFYRYALRESLYWATEVPNFMLIWIVFLGAVIAFHEKQHIAFTLLQEMLPQRGNALLDLIATLIVISFLLVFAVFGAKLVLVTMNSLSEALKIPMGYVYACLPLSATLMTISALGKAWEAVLRLTGKVSP
jgi:TRAP-type C4-dicarboxylate transport system permease small subunit